MFMEYMIINRLMIEDKSVMFRALMMMTGVNIDKSCMLGMFNPMMVNKSIVRIDTTKIAIAI
jgi:hypothetical protein